MGGYAGFVWSAYAITLFVVMGNLYYTRFRHRKVLDQLSRERKLSDDASLRRDSERVVVESGERVI